MDRGLIPFAVVSLVTIFLIPFGWLSYETEWYGGSYYWIFAMSWHASRGWGWGFPEIRFHPFLENIWFHPLGASIVLAWTLQVLFFAAIILNIVGKTGDVIIFTLGLLGLIPIPVSGFVYYSGNAIAMPIPIYLFVGLVLMTIHRRLYGKLV